MLYSLLFFYFVCFYFNPSDMESKVQYNKRLNKKKGHVTSKIRYQCDFLIQILVDLKESVNNNSINYDHVMALHNLLYKAKSDCKLLSQAVLEISGHLEQLDGIYKEK